MAIKVKHEGNVTSRVVAANMGGQAQSSQQQALALSQKSAGENAAANRQLSGANAPGVDLLSADAQLGSAHAGTMSAPKFTPLEESHLVTKNRVNENQRWDSDLQAYVGNYMTGQKAAYKDEQMRSVSQPWEAELLKAKEMVKINNLAASSAISTNAQPKVNGVPAPSAQTAAPSADVLAPSAQTSTPQAAVQPNDVQPSSSFFNDVMSGIANGIPGFVYGQIVNPVPLQEAYTTMLNTATSATRERARMFGVPFNAGVPSPTQAVPAQGGQPQQNGQAPVQSAPAAASVFNYTPGVSYADGLAANTGYSSAVSSYDKMAGIMDAGLYGYQA